MADPVTGDSAGIVLASSFIICFSVVLCYYIFFKKEKPVRELPSKEKLLQARIQHFKVAPHEHGEDRLKTATSDKNLKGENSKSRNLKNLNEIFLKSHFQENNGEPIAKPISSLEELFSWLPGYDEFSIGRIKRKSIYRDEKRSKTLVCHDMRGGYVEDRFPQGYHSSQCYRFHYWNLIDSFCYFSHHFVTIPPPCWTNAGHIHGVKVFGTFITESDEGEKICAHIFQDLEQVKKTVKILVDIASYYQFDGWLLNIENEIVPTQVENLVAFIKLLTGSMHKNIKDSEVIWYDSVIYTGHLKWQNKLCSENRIFFDPCDGIFLNYGWNFNDLQHSLYMSGAKRQQDVYVGVDVFGRGCFGGGGWNTYKALQVSREKSLNLSAAIFAPGWVMEKFGADEFTKYNQRFWELLTSYLYAHYISTLPLASSFCQGYGEKIFIKGELIVNTPWTNLSAQSLQPTFSSNIYQLGPKSAMNIKDMSYCTSDAYNGGGCMNIVGTVKPEKEQTRTVFRMFKTNIKLDHSEEYIVRYTFKRTTKQVELFLLLLFEDSPQYMVFGPQQSENNDVNNYYALPKNQEDNYVVVPPLFENTQAQWKTRHYVVKLDHTRCLQEARFSCTAGGVVDKNVEEDFSMKLGDLKICSEKQFSSAIASASNIRCRNICIVEKDKKTDGLSFTLTWDYYVYHDTLLPKCFDIFCLRSSDPLQSKETFPENCQFIGRAFADAYYISDLIVPKECRNGLKLAIQAISYADVRQKKFGIGVVTLQW